MTRSVVVVGGGLVGLACAHYLRDEGFEVTVIDQNRIGGGCSHGNCGMVLPSHVLPLASSAALWDGCKSLFNPRAAFRIRPQARLGLYRWLMAFALRCREGAVKRNGQHLQALLGSSVEMYRALAKLPDLGAQWREDGLLYAFETERGLDAFREEDEFIQKEFGLAARFFNSTDLADYEPALKPGLAGGFLYEDDGWLRPDSLIRGWATHLTGRGVRFMEDCRFLHLERSGSCADALITTRGAIETDHFVFAAGAWSAKLAETLDCKIPVEPGKGYSVTLSKPPQVPRQPMLLPERRVGVTPFEDGFRLGSMMEFTGFDSSIPPHRIRQLQESARPYLRQPTGGAVLESWYGWRPMTWDSLPIIGPVPKLDNAVLATGHNMLGVTLAPVTGQLVAELVAGREPHLDISPFSPRRF